MKRDTKINLGSFTNRGFYMLEKQTMVRFLRFRFAPQTAPPIIVERFDDGHPTGRVANKKTPAVARAL